LQPGLEARVEKDVPFEWTIAYYDARFPAVFSTPAMIGMMEWAAEKAVQPALASRLDDRRHADRSGSSEET
jgi:predicted thioesterase